jgi:hypothetical protein
MMATRTGAAAGDTGSPSARAAAAGEEEAGLGKVKLLGSFAGRIAPRSGDGALRYVGGQMRLISVPRLVTHAHTTFQFPHTTGEPAETAKQQEASAGTAQPNPCANRPLILPQLGRASLSFRTSPH